MMGHEASLKIRCEVLPVNRRRIRCFPEHEGRDNTHTDLL